MKSLSIFFGFLLLSIFVFPKETLESKRDIVGEVYNIPGRDETEAFTHGAASTRGYNLQDDSHYVLPEIVNRLPEKVDPPKTGPIEVVDEVPSPVEYYNGETKLNKVVINCHIYSNPTDCVHQNYCGWCGASKSCIVGNNMGPLENCVKTSYIFATHPHQAKYSYENIDGLSLSMIR